MPSDRSVIRVLPGSLVPLAVRTRESAERLLPDGPLPLARIARYAALALVVYAVGVVSAAAAFAVLDVFSVVFYSLPGDLLADAWVDLAALVRDAVEAFALLVALGVFLTQFESGAPDGPDE
ncbi:hypothetical protein [Halobaculum sp. EA56]|uniref:hypothetical protein n=1 Tax=Halobaculum sp. EA56 TaxID=3421648 RepID=UPI003EBC5F62